jgi:Spy/CpxP family protein refolding chaperone
VSKSYKHFVSGALLLLGVATAAGCGATQGVDEELDSAEAEIDGARERAHGPHRRGPGGMLKGIALEDLDLSAEQRAKIEALFEKDAPTDEAREEHAAKARALAVAVRAGRVDVASLTEKDATRPDLRARFATDLDALHALLTPAQRADLVAALKERAPKGPPEGRGPHEGGPDLLRGISVTDLQREAIAKALTDAGIAPSPKKVDKKAKMDAVLTAFVRDDFEADAVLPEPPEGAPGPRRRIAALAVVVPLLTPDQRDQLAARIEAGPPRHE